MYVRYCAYWWWCRFLFIVCYLFGPPISCCQGNNLSSWGPYKKHIQTRTHPNTYNGVQKYGHPCVKLPVVTMTLSMKAMNSKWYRVKHETFLLILFQVCFLLEFLKNGKGPLCKSLGTLLDYSLILKKIYIMKDQTEVISSIGLHVF